MMRLLMITLTLTFSTSVFSIESTAVTSLLKQYQTNSVTLFSAQTGRDLWRKEYASRKTGATRSCSNCHTGNLSVVGKHVKTKKLIEPLAPSINRKRLTNIKTMKKWLKRNCKWTLGRECTAQEKGHLLKFIQSQ